MIVGHSVVLWYGTSHQFFERSGKATKCYVVTRDELRYGVHPGIDSSTGRECRPVTPEIVERLRAYEKGVRPQRITEAEPTYFDPRTGEPIVWYYKNENGDIEIFNLMGFTPETGKELLPVSQVSSNCARVSMLVEHHNGLTILRSLGSLIGLRANLASGTDALIVEATNSTTAQASTSIRGNRFCLLQKKISMGGKNTYERTRQGNAILSQRMLALRFYTANGRESIRRLVANAEN